HLPNIALTKDALLLAKRLQAIYTYERIDEIFPTLETLPNLHKVVFWDDSDVDEVNGRSPTRQSPPSPNHLPWGSFAYHCIRPRFHVSILQRLLYLTSLEFVGDLGLLLDAIAILHDLKKLRRFATHLSLDDSEENHPSNPIFPCPSVRSLVITIHHRSQPDIPNSTSDGRPL
ncbi:5580_t:CDS:1, partial [Acaulospora colombiana]